MAQRLKLLLPGLFLLIFPWLAPNSYYLDLGTKVAIYGIVAMGLGILIGQAGQISLGQAALFGVGAYTAALINLRLGWGIWLSLPLAALAGALVSLVLGFTALRLRGHFLAMITLAFSLIFSGVVRGWMDVTGGPGGLSGIESPQLFGFSFSSERAFFYLAWVICVALLVFGHNICSSRTGRALSAIRQNEVSARAIGINVTLYKLQVFVLSGAFAGIGGGLFAHYLRYISPDSFTLHFSVMLLSMIVIGGLRQGAWGGLAGALVLTLLPELLRALGEILPLPGRLNVVFTDYTYQLIIYGLLVFLTVLFLPGGAVSLFQRKSGSKTKNNIKVGKGRAVGVL